MTYKRRKRYSLLIIGLLFIFIPLYGIIKIGLDNYDSLKDIALSKTVETFDGNDTIVVIDRFEDGYAVCEKDDNSSIEISSNALPKGVKEGDVLKIKGKTIIIDLKETEKRKAEVNLLMKEIE